MANKIKVWFDAEADFLEVRFSDAIGYQKETNNDAVMERVDALGHVIGFSVMGVSRFKKGNPLEADLLAAYAPSYASSVGGEDNAQVTIANTVTGSNKIQDQSGTGAHMRIAGFYQSAQEVSGQTTLGGEITWLWNQQWRVQCDAGIYSGTGSRCGSANNRCHRG